MKPPTPLCTSFVICRNLLLDEYTKQYVLVGPLHELIVPSFPLIHELSGFAKLNSANGKYVLELLLENSKGEVVWKDHLQVQVEIHDPVLPLIIAIHKRQVFFPQAGKYEFVILANGEEVTRDNFWAHLPNQTPRELLEL